MKRSKTGFGILPKIWTKLWFSNIRELFVWGLRFGTIHVFNIVIVWIFVSAGSWFPTEPTLVSLSNAVRNVSRNSWKIPLLGSMILSCSVLSKSSRSYQSPDWALTWLFVQTVIVNQDINCRSDNCKQLWFLAFNKQRSMLSTEKDLLCSDDQFIQTTINDWMII